MAVNKSLFYKELSKKDSNQKLQDLLKRKVKLQAGQHFKPGNIVFTSYNAKHKEFTYDKTPLVLILKRGSRYTLGLNFHWLPVPKRVLLISEIMRRNKRNIEAGRPLDFDYNDLKPMLKNLDYAPCIRKYINPRFGKIGVPIPPDRLMEVARMKGQTFTNGKYSSEQLFRMAKKAGKKRNKMSK